MALLMVLIELIKRCYIYSTSPKPSRGSFLEGQVKRDIATPPTLLDLPIRGPIDQTSFADLTVLSRRAIDDCGFVYRSETI